MGAVYYGNGVFCQVQFDNAQRNAARFTLHNSIRIPANNAVNPDYGMPRSNHDDSHVFGMRMS
jgi:hypothetical protein